MSVKHAGRIGAAAVLIALVAGLAGAGELVRPRIGEQPAAMQPKIPEIAMPPALPRPEMRSYQPYSGLQYGFRPERAGRRGIRPKEEERPEVVMPEPVPPLIEYGRRSSGAGRYYSYCPENARCR